MLSVVGGKVDGQILFDTRNEKPKILLAPGMRNETIYLAPNGSYEKLYLAVKGLKQQRFQDDGVFFIMMCIVVIFQVTMWRKLQMWPVQTKF